MAGLARRVTHWSASDVKLAFRKASLACRNTWLDVRLRHLPVVQGVPAPRGRVLIVTPKKVGSAPYRNLLKRRARAIIAQQRLSLPHIDIILFFNPNPSVPLTFSQLQEFLQTCLKKHQSSTL